MKKSLIALAIAGAMTGALMPHEIVAQSDYGKRQRRCLNRNCGNLHSHNNAFCSAECCRQYRNKETTDAA